MSWAGITAGAGRNPLSLPIWIQSGPFGLSVVSTVGWITGSICAAATSDFFNATSVNVPVVGSATYQDRFQNRSLDALSIRNRYAFGSTDVVGYAVPFTTGVSLNASIPTDTFGVDGICAGSQNGCTFGSQLES